MKFMWIVILFTFLFLVLATYRLFMLAKKITL